MPAALFQLSLALAGVFAGAALLFLLITHGVSKSVGPSDD
jgi:hypothetical protein